MVIDFDQGKTEHSENKKFFQKLRKQSPKVIDQQFHELHDDVFEEIDCLDCANCCKTTSPIFLEKDIDRIAKSMRMKPADFIDTYLQLDTDGLYMLQTSPCPFLGADNYCGIYEVRPKACGAYPHTHQNGMRKLLNLTLKNTLVCPAVAEMVHRMKQAYINK